MKTRIGILGLGGVGGYFGGLLARAYFDTPTIEIVFIARGETQKAILEFGLKIQTDSEEIIVYPDLVSDVAETIGVLDYLICATKTYDIESSLAKYSHCISSKTVILPLYNGVDAPVRIQTIFPETTVLQGCTYIVSMIESPGVIRKVGFYEKIYFGSETVSFKKLLILQSIFEKAKIESYLVAEIQETIWKKFVFISPLATVSTFLNQNIGQILSNAESKLLYVSLLNEITQLAHQKKIQLPIDIVSQTILKLEKTPLDATSSMHRDFLAGRRTEIDSLTQYVYQQGIALHVPTPTYEMILKKLKG